MSSSFSQQERMHLSSKKTEHLSVGKSDAEQSWNAHSCNLAFSKVPWGGVACEFMKVIKKLQEPHWASIYTHTANFMGRSKQFVDYDGHFLADKCKEADCPQTCIQIE